MNALIVAGGQWQVPLIKFLKKKGYTTFVIDPYDHSLGVLAADNHIKADVRDVVLIKKLIQDITFDIVTTDQSDISVDTVAVISQELGLYGNPIDVVEKFSNKYLSREYAQTQQIPIPAYELVQTKPQVETFIEKYGFPVIIKPCDSQSSKGIHKITEENSSSIEDGINDALLHSKQNTCLVEKFVSGHEITVEGYCSNMKHKTLAISKKSHFRTGIASSLSYPADMPEYLKEKIIIANDKYVENSGLKFGITHAEYIVDEASGEFYLVEIACRGGGTLISSDIIHWVSGFNVYDALFNDLTGVSTSVKEIKELRRNAILHFFEFPEGKVKTIKGLDFVREMEGVLDISLNFTIGDVLTKANDDRGRQGFVILLTNSLEEQAQKLNCIINALEIEYE